MIVASVEAQPAKNSARIPTVYRPPNEDREKDRFANEAANAVLKVVGLMFLIMFVLVGVFVWTGVLDFSIH